MPFVPPSGIDPTASPLLVTLRNANGIVYSASIPAGSLRTESSGWSYDDKAAKATGGIFQVRLRWARANGHARVLRAFVKARGEFADATLADMTLSVTVAGQSYESSATWRSLAKGGWIVDNLS